MKNKKKHNFVHKDPEIIKKSVGASKKATIPLNIPNEDFFLIKKDLKKTILMVGAFFILVFAFYFIQIKTDWLKPVLNIFHLS